MKEVLIYIIAMLVVGALILSGEKKETQYTQEIHNITTQYQADINEYEFILADVWAEREDYRNQLGVFAE